MPPIHAIEAPRKDSEPTNNGKVSRYSDRRKGELGVMDFRQARDEERVYSWPLTRRRATDRADARVIVKRTLLCLGAAVLVSVLYATGWLETFKGQW